MINGQNKIEVIIKPRDVAGASRSGAVRERTYVIVSPTES